MNNVQKRPGLYFLLFGQEVDIIFCPRVDFLGIWENIIKPRELILCRFCKTIAFGSKTYLDLSVRAVLH